MKYYLAKRWEGNRSYALIGVYLQDWCFGAKLQFTKWEQSLEFGLGPFYIELVRW